MDHYYLHAAIVIIDVFCCGDWEYDDLPARRLQRDTIYSERGCRLGRDRVMTIDDYDN
jgi:hypothetical protein